MSNVDSFFLRSSDLSIQPFSNKGDSGQLLLATHKANGAQYILKHAFPECACNEFMYSVIGTMLGDRIPETRLVALSSDDHRKFFGSQYVVAIRYIRDAMPPSFEAITSNKAILEQWVVSQAVSWMLSEDDGTDYLLTKDQQLYRIDTSSSFSLTDTAIRQISSSSPVSRSNGIYMMAAHLHQYQDVETYKCEHFLDITNRNIGKDCSDIFHRPLRRLLDLDWLLIEQALDALARVYPVQVCGYYIDYLEILEEKVNHYFSML